ncbi:GNAT family N-acetyltransferase [Klebsiella sp. I138]|uniref:GNAT family N-acetyltransferase n=1 Tax=Klebsiella sp. I138 TaxID=2755385 RepID=UPI003DA9374F
MKSNTITATATFRLATPNDIPFLPAIERSAAQAFRALPDLAWLADSPTISLSQHHGYVETGHSLVAIVNGQLAGFLLTEPLDDALFIAEISVLQVWQGKGLGRQMIAQTLDHARKMAFPAVTLTTFRNVSWNAPFYARLGFYILHEQTLPAGLAARRQLESAHGLAPETRCAMRLTL